MGKRVLLLVATNMAIMVLLGIVPNIHTGAAFVWKCIEVGNFALVMKEGMQRGDFTMWLEDASEMKHGPSVRQSRRYMAAAKRAEAMGLTNETAVVAVLGEDANLAQLTSSAKNAIPTSGDRSPSSGDESNGLPVRLNGLLESEESQIKRYDSVAQEYPEFADSKQLETFRSSLSQT